MRKRNLILLLFAIFALTFCKKEDDANPSNMAAVENILWQESSTGSGSVYIYWDHYEGAQSYQVFLDGTEDSSTPFVGNSYLTYFIAHNTEIMIEAYSDVEATNIIARGKVTFIAEDGGSSAIAPDPVTALQTTEVGDTSVSLSWENPSDFYGIEIYTSEKNDTTVPIVTIDQTDISTYTVGNLADETEHTLYMYTFKVNIQNDTLYSNAASVTFTTSKQIMNLEITGYGYYAQYGGGLRLSVRINGNELFNDQSEWQNTDDLVLKIYSAESLDGEYELANTKDYISPNFDQWGKIEMIVAYQSAMGYIEGNTYYLKVTAENKNGELLGESVVQEIEYPTSNDIIPDKPTGLTLNKSGNCVDISWNQATDAVKYKVWVSTSSNMGNRTLVKETTGTTAQDCDRGQNVKMYYQVTAYSSTGNGNSSDIVSIWL